MTTTTKRMKFQKLRFFEDIGYVPHPGQLEVHRSTAPRRVLACGVRWGKSVCAAAEAIAAAMVPCERSVGWIVGPTFDLADKIYREVVIFATERLRHRLVTLREGDKKIVMRNLAGGLSEIRAKSADNPTSLLGEGLSWVVVDEAARLKPSVWQSHLSQRLIDKQGWALLVSTPKGRGWFFEQYKRGQGEDPAYASWNGPTSQNPFIDPKLIEAERGRLPERVFQEEYLGRFVEGSGAVFRNVHTCAVGSFEEPISGETYFGGLDLGRTTDFTVLILMNRKREVVFADRFTRIDSQVAGTS